MAGEKDSDKKVSMKFTNMRDFPPMVRWFSPKVLGKTVRKVVESTMFGQYADRRLVHASLDSPIDADKFKERCGGDGGILGGKDGEVWVDYVADLGDGFNSTYAIAYLIGQKSLPVAGFGADETLPRADCLVMGGDQVYPDASRETYEYRMKRPYKFAFPGTKREGAAHPRLLLIPGNHDWYDGLTLFLANFCRGRPTSLGSWDAQQNRSYFAVQLKDGWWLWGYDSQLGEDIDKPQADYFSEVGRAMKPGSKVILCASVPTWLEAELSSKEQEHRDRFNRGLKYIAQIARDECKGAKVPLVLSGDLHHYSRYVARESGTNFITAGGGGAFLHPTHHLPGSIHLEFVRDRQHLALAPKNGTDPAEKTEACYPSRDQSRDLASGNWSFAWKNWDFCLTLGGLYALAGLFLLWWDGYGARAGDGFGEQLLKITPTPAFVVLGALLWAILYRYADIRPTGLKRSISALHAVLHLAIIAVASAWLSFAGAPLLAAPFGQILYLGLLVIGFLIAGFVGGVFWGLYLLLVSRWLGMHANDAFSAMRLDKFRHFLRLKISGDTLTVYPIGIDEAPRSSDWKENTGRAADDQDAPIVVPKKPLGQHFIEKPVVIDTAQVKPVP